MATTIWNDIYNDYLAGGKAWATIGAQLHPGFLALVENSTFARKNALDIGCGTGSYLRHLREKGFAVTGLDSSETAIKMTRELLHDQGLFTVADMYEYDYPADTYDLIISHCTAPRQEAAGDCAPHANKLGAAAGRKHLHLTPKQRGQKTLDHDERT